MLNIFFMILLASSTTKSLTKLRKPLQSSSFSFQANRYPTKTRMTSTSLPTESQMKLSLRNQVIVLAGATSAGKSAVAMELTQIFDSEIVIGDSVQVYKHADIGSNKPTPEEQAIAPHHLLDLLDSTQDREISSGEYVRLATAAIRDILSRGKTPIVVGGSTMWLEWLIHGVPDAPKATEETVSHVKSLLAPYIERGAWEEAFTKCRAMVRNPSRLDKLSTNDWYRLSRCLEVEFSTSKSDGSTSQPSSASSAQSIESVIEPASATQTSRVSTLSDLDVRCFFLSEDREELYRIIDTRCLDMLQRGLFEETAALILGRHMKPDSMLARAIGYRQAIKCLCNPNREQGDKTALEAFIKEFSTATRNYAKRQLQWHRRDEKFLWLQIFRSYIAQRPERRQKQSGPFDKTSNETRASSSEPPSTSPYTTVTNELVHWLSVSAEEFRAALTRQLECGDLATRIRVSRNRVRSNRRAPSNSQWDNQARDKYNSIDGKSETDKSNTDTPLEQSGCYNAVVRALVQTGELPDSWLDSLEDIGSPEEHSSLSALDPKIRASDAQNSTKTLREYIQLIPPSVLSSEGSTRGPSLLQRADESASKLLQSTENADLVSDFYRTATS